MEAINPRLVELNKNSHIWFGVVTVITYVPPRGDGVFPKVSGRDHD